MFTPDTVNESQKAINEMQVIETIPNRRFWLGDIPESDPTSTLLDMHQGRIEFNRYDAIRIFQYEFVAAITEYHESVFTEYRKSKYAPETATEYSSDYTQSKVEWYGSIRINREQFDIEFEEQSFHIVHRKWSLMGTGATLVEAEIDLMREARELAKIMVGMNEEELDDSARKLLSFVLPYVTLNASDPR